MIIIEELKDNKIDLEQFDTVPYGSDMFFQAFNSIIQHECAVAVDEENQPVALLKWQENTYVHRYKYSGGVDMSFMNQYNCLFLHDCNEYSVELCQSALKLWEGKRLVLVGKNWERMIPLLPDLPGIECFYEEALTDQILYELMAGMKFLHVIFGVPHAEPMDRYNKGIMYYDEIMSFVFMFSDYRELGDKNPDKNFFVVDGFYDNLGLFALFPKIEACAAYAKSKGFVPVIRLTMSNSSKYSNYNGDDIWGKFYNQPEGYSLDEVMHSRNVYFSPGLYNGSVQSNIMNEYSKSTTLSWPMGKYNKQVCDYIESHESVFLPYPDRTLGVLARGTDYVNTHLSNHPIHASLDMLCDKIDWALKEWKLDYIYVATEDESYCDALMRRYGDQVTFTDQKRYTVREGEMLTQMHSREEKRDGYLLGIEYILSINLLSKCHSLIASGYCGGVDEALKENQGQYKNVFIFDLGVNP